MASSEVRRRVAILLYVGGFCTNFTVKFPVRENINKRMQHSHSLDSFHIPVHAHKAVPLVTISSHNIYYYDSFHCLDSNLPCILADY